MSKKFSKAVALAALLALARVASAQDAGEGFIMACKPGYFGLSFDDGPSNNTGKLLDFLAEAKVNVTFFVLGTSLTDETSNFTKRAFDEGHQIASHTWDHKSLNTLTDDEIKEEMLKNEAAIKKVIKATPNYMRPPYGDCDDHCKTVLSQMGYHVVQWNIDSNDWRYEDIPENWKRVTEDIMMIEDVNTTISSNASTGYISLQHDTLWFSVDQVPQIIKNIQAKGLKIVPIEQCLENPPAPMYRTGQFSNSTAPSNSSSSAPRAPPPKPPSSPDHDKGADLSGASVNGGSGALGGSARAHHGALAVAVVAVVAANLRFR